MGSIKEVFISLGEFMYIYKTIIFDLDGTLFQTDTVFVNAFRKICASRGVRPQSEEEIKGLIGAPMTEICRNTFGENLTDSEIDQIRSEIRELENENLDQSGRLYDDVNSMLEQLELAGFTLCICSNGSKPYVENILEKFDIKNKFSIVKSRNEGLTKTHLIKQILDECKCCSAIVVGDTSYDFEAAKETGCLSIGVSYGYGGDAYEHADFSVHQAIDIFNTIIKINNFYRNIAIFLNDKKTPGRPLIVGINGVDTSGKTIFTKELCNYLSQFHNHLQVIHLDDFHNPSDIRNKESDPVISYFNNAFNLESIEENILKPTSIGERLDKEFLLLNLENDLYDVKKRYIVNEDTIVLLEGVLLFREPIDQYMDVKIYIDISFDEVIIRAQKRDYKLFGDATEERYRKKYIPVQKLYFEKHSPKEKSHLVINNENFAKPQIEKIPFNGPLAEKKIRFEPIEDRHIQAIRKMYADSFTQEMLGIISFPEIDHFNEDHSLSYAIVDLDNEFIGIVEFFNISWKNRRAELSITIEASKRSKGYGYDAIQNILSIGFHQLGFNRIWLRVLESNIKAIDLYQRIGFFKEGICREESLRQSKFVNQIQMSLLKNEWQS